MELRSLKFWGSIALLLFAAISGGYFFMGSHKSPQDQVLRMSMPVGYGPETSDPARILFNSTWGDLENLASPLIEYSADGQLQAGVAKTFEWKGDALHLAIRDDYKTIDGQAITAEDVAFSLKRVIVLARNTHGFIADFLCGDARISKVTDDCPGIQIQGNSVVLKPIRGKAFLVRMLTAMDFVVLFRSQVDPETLAIKSFRNTTGPYFLDVGSDGHQKYLPNKHHWNYSPSMPQVVDLVPWQPNVYKASRPELGSTFSLFMDNQADVVNNFGSDRSDLYPLVAKQSKDVLITPTQDIGRIIAVFTPRGIRELSKTRRVSIGKTLRAAATTALVDGEVNHTATQFFATFGESALNDQELAQVEKMFADALDEADGRGLTIAFPRSMLSIKAAIAEKLPKANLESNTVDYIEKNQKAAEPHVYLIQTDTGWTEDLGLLAYSISMNQFFPNDQAQGQAWLNHYVEVEDKGSRLELLRSLHQRVLSEPWIVPLVSQPYFTLVRSPWQYKGPTLFNSGALWRFHRP